MLGSIQLFARRCFFLLLLFINSSYAENEDVHMDEFIGDDIFNYYQKLAEKHDEEEKDYTVLNNDFYENEYIRVFNYTAYNSDNFSNKLGTGEFNADLDALSISFGYGIEIKINKRNKLGYEYLSNFPYDRGQLIRLYWVHLLKFWIFKMFYLAFKPAGPE